MRCEKEGSKMSVRKNTLYNIRLLLKHIRRGTAIYLQYRVLMRTYDAPIQTYRCFIKIQSKIPEDTARDFVFFVCLHAERLSLNEPFPVDQTHW